MPEKYRPNGAKRGPVPLGQETRAERTNVLLSDWFLSFQAEIERARAEVLLLRSENCALRQEVRALRAPQARS